MNDFVFTSDFWSWFIIVLSLGYVFGCWWLIVWASKRREGEAATGDVTGHTWDETLQEYNNPLPRWWLWLFYGTMVFGLVYFALYPGLGKFQGILGWTEESQYEEEMAAAEQRYAPIFKRYASQDLAALAKDPEATKIGHRLYLNYCAVCHGSDAGGGPGFPSLKDDDWLWGGEPEAIKASIMNGRQGAMPAWGPIIGDQGVEQVAAYVQSLSGRNVDAGLAAAGKPIFETNCAACHGMDGKGNTALGAPNLTDNIWLYGASAGAIKQTIANGRNGVMPAHGNFLGEDKVHLLAAYIYSLSAK